MQGRVPFNRSKAGPTEMAHEPTSGGGVHQGSADPHYHAYDEKHRINFAARQQKIGAPRYGLDPITLAVDLGPLANLAGTWKGSGFSQMWRPDNTDPASNNPSAIRRFLQLNQTRETLTFTTIPNAIPNRGVGDQPDITIYGLHYLQSINDGDPKKFPNHGEALHIEPGLFLNVPGSGKKADGTPVADGNVMPATIVRLGTVPHGVSVLMQGLAPSTIPVAGPPTIPDIYPIPELPAFATDPPPMNAGRGIQPANLGPYTMANPTFHAVPEVVLSADVAGSQSNGPYDATTGVDPALFQRAVDNPNQLLRDAIAGQDVLGHITLDLTSEFATDSLNSANTANSIGNIPFLGIPQLVGDTGPHAVASNNALVKSARATFWIEFVRSPHHGPDRGHGEHPFDAPHYGPLHGLTMFQGQHVFMQLQYSQVVILVFNKVLWPHITVATLQLTHGF
jgi:hypothetical protein